MSKSNTLKTLISLFILSVIGLQAFTSFRAYTYLPLVFPPASHLNLEQVRSPQLWPFLTYPMYRSAYYEGDEFFEYRAYATFSDSSVVRVMPKDLNINFWKFRSDFVPSIRKGKNDKSIKYLSLIEDKYKRNPVKLRIKKKVWVLQTEGAIEGSTEVVKDFRVCEDK